MAFSSPVDVPLIQSLSVHTGNIVRLKRGGVQSASSEFSECITSTIQTWLEGQDEAGKQSLQTIEDMECFNANFLEKLPAEERQEYKITVKIFLSNLREDAVKDAISKVLEDLGVTSVETVILSVPEPSHHYSALKDLWRTLESEVDAHRVYSLGVSDLNKAQLEELYNSVQVKPCINQVNLTSCCVIPPELTEFAKAHDVQLLTHNDPPVILTAEDCQTLISGKFSVADVERWQPYFVVRYSVLIKTRGIIKTKGFIMRAVRDSDLSTNHS